MSKEITEADFIDLALKTLGHGLIPVGRANFKLANEYAKSQCISFAKYENTEAIRSGEDHWKHRGDNFKESITTDQLYDLFIQHQSQQP